MTLALALTNLATLLFAATYYVRYHLTNDLLNELIETHKKNTHALADTPEA